MGFLTPNFDKPGRGVYADEPEKRAFFLYFEIVFAKFFSFMGSGFLHSLFSLPVFVLIYYISGFVFIEPIKALNTIFMDNVTEITEAGMDLNTLFEGITFSIRIMSAMLFTQLFGTGPLSAGLSYVYRSFARREPTFVVYDGRMKAKENFKFATIVLVLDIIAFCIFPTAIMFYLKLTKTDGMELAAMIALCIAILITVIYIIMHPFLYQLMVTLELKLKDLFKNALILSIVSLPLGIVLTAVSVLIIALPIFLGSVMGAVILTFFVFTIGGAFLRFPMEFYASRVVKKYFIDNNTRSDS